MRSRTVRFVGLEDFPAVKAAVDADGAIRVFDGRWSGGFVDDQELAKCVRLGLLVERTCGGELMAVRPGFKGGRPKQ